MTPNAWKALAFMEKGDIGRARCVVVPEIEKHPEEPDNWLALGIIHAYNKDYDWAAQSLEKFLQCLENRFNEK